jgi:hypothetical protein
MAERVHFRVIEGEVIALFPDDKRDPCGAYIGSYMHVGQHGNASQALVDELPAATLEQYGALKRELESEPFKYVLDIQP